MPSANTRESCTRNRKIGLPYVPPFDPVLRSHANWDLEGSGGGPGPGFGELDGYRAVDRGVPSIQPDLHIDDAVELESHLRCAHCLQQPSPTMHPDACGRGDRGGVSTDWLRDGVDHLRGGEPAVQRMAEPRDVQPHAELGAADDGGPRGEAESGADQLGGAVRQADVDPAGEGRPCGGHHRGPPLYIRCRGRCARIGRRR